MSAATGVRVLRSGSEGRLAIEGVVTERTDFSALAKALLEARGGEPVLDVGGVERINSAGVREWVLFLEKRAGAPGAGPLTLVRCPPEFVQQLNTVAGFARGCAVRSVLAPYRCEKCGAESLVEIATAGDPVSAVREPRSCTRCKGATSFDDLEEAYFAFLG